MQPRIIAILVVKQTVRCAFIVTFSIVLYSLLVCAFGIVFFVYQAAKKFIEAGFSFHLASIYFEVDAEISGWASFSEMMPIAFILGVISGVVLWINDVCNNGKSLDGALIETVEWLTRK